MILYLTSSPTGDLDGRYLPEGIDNRNGFLDRLMRVWPENAECLIIAASPDEHFGNDQMRAFFHHAVMKSGLSCSCFDLWDDRMERKQVNQLNRYDVVFLGGGHVPTQMRFFESIGLRDEIQSFEGIVIGMSAGSMNCADTVYAVPELQGEAISTEYDRWIQGLGITQVHILPHHQMVRHNLLDGMRLFEDIIYPDSAGNTFISIPDGSYIEQDRNGYRIFGEYYLIQNGTMTYGFDN